VDTLHKGENYDDDDNNNNNNNKLNQFIKILQTPENPFTIEHCRQRVKTKERKNNQTLEHKGHN
jgi:hypothetical protein